MSKQRDFVLSFTRTKRVLWKHVLSILGVLLLSISPVAGITDVGPTTLAPSTGDVINLLCPSSFHSVMDDALREYNLRYGGKVELERLPADEYDRLLQNAMSFGDLPDLICTDPSSASLHYLGGWIEPLNRIFGYAEIKSQMLPSMWKIVSHNDLLLGLPYAGTVKNIVLVNQSRNNVHRMVPPTTWSEVYFVATEASRQIGRPSLVPAWSEESIALAFIGEVMNRSSVQNIDKLELNGDFAKRVLVDWLAAKKQGVVPFDSLATSASSAEERAQSGDYLLAVTSLSTLFSDQAVHSPTGDNRFTLVSGVLHRWGVLDTRMISMVRKPSRSESQAEDIRRFLHWFIFKDEGGESNNSEHLLNKAKLFPSYNFLSDPAANRFIVEAALGDKDNAASVVRIYNQADYPAEYLVSPLAEELLETMRVVLVDYLNEKQGIEATIEKLRELSDKYGN